MRITDLRIVVHERRMPSGTGPATMPLGVMTISTDEGIEGHVFLSGPGADVTQQLVSVAKPMLLGRDPLDIGAIWHDLAGRQRMLHPTVQGYVDIALWDIAGKAAGMPVHRLLGSCRTRVPAYASSWVHADDPTYAEEAAAYAAAGLAGYKIHPPTQRRHMPVGDGSAVTIADDIAVCRDVRAAVGDGYRLMLDAAWAYTWREALDVGFAIQDLGYHWYEDPLGAEDIPGYVRLKQHLWMPVVATEITAGGLQARAGPVRPGSPVLRARRAGHHRLRRLRVRSRAAGPWDRCGLGPDPVRGARRSAVTAEHGQLKANHSSRESEGCAGWLRPER